jgi:ElaB/YqjD/DUF883 family membrane-anchored ribosome-binding protein
VKADDIGELRELWEQAEARVSALQRENDIARAAVRVHSDFRQQAEAVSARLRARADKAERELEEARAEIARLLRTPRGATTHDAPPRLC